MYLSECSDSINPVIRFLFDTMNVEVAVIDRYGQLIATTQGYTVRKGTQVHVPFLDLVFSEKFVVVNNPGYTTQCDGCRFRADCPSSVELLASIYLDDQPIGVISLVGFTKSARNRITHDIERYQSILDNASQWIANLVKLHMSARTSGEPVTARSDTGSDTAGQKNRGDGLTQRPVPGAHWPEDGSLYTLIGNSDPMKELRKRIARIAKFGSSVLIQGESGSGKSVAARAIHEASDRRNGPFVTVNCASLPESLIESELFGYAEGAFTGARRGGKPGYFELANHGTIFLDEIGELPLHLQPKLLTVLEERTIHRIGGTRRTPVDVRVLAATNRDLQESVNRKRFRLDLFHRLNVIPLTMPALREHAEDIPYLAQASLQRLQRAHQEPPKSLSEEALHLLMDYEWPGNVRELENALEYAYCMEDTSAIVPSSLPPHLHASPRESVLTTNVQHAVEQKLILNALNKYGFDVKGKKKAADDLGMSVRTLYRKLERMGIHT